MCKLNPNFIDFVFVLFSDIHKKNVKLLYEGEINHDIIKAITSQSETDLKARNEAKPTLKKVFNIMVESLQNISKHADYIDDLITKNGKGLLLFNESDKNYNITTGNVINTKNAEIIKNNIDIVNSLNKQELRELYKKRLLKGRTSDIDGTGLGFIDIRRKSNNKLKYKFFKINEHKFFYILSTVIEKL